MKKIAIAVLVFAIIGGLFVSNPTFKLATIEIDGANFNNQARLIDTMKVYKGQNSAVAFVVHLVKNDLVRKFPTIKRVSSRLVWPNKLKISIEEKKPWLSFLVEGRSVLISADGTILTKEAGNFHLDNLNQLIIFRGLSNSFFKTAYLNQQLLNEVKSMVEIIDSALTGAALQVEAIGAVLEKNQLFIDEIVLHKDDTLPIKLGRPHNLQEKLDTLRHFLPYYGEKISEVLYLDLRAPGKVIVGYNS